MKTKTIKVKISAEFVIDDHDTLSDAANAIEGAIDAMSNYGEAHLDSFVVD